MLNKIISDFKQYLAVTNLKQYNAAEQLGIEKGHLNRILTGKRNLTPQIAVDMRRLMGEKNILSLKECMKKYPIGSYFVNFKFYFSEKYQYNPYMSKEQCILASQKEKDLYLPQKDEECFIFTFIFQDIETKRYQLMSLWGERITAYGTNDGLTFFPLLRNPNDDTYLYKKEPSQFSLIDELLLSDFSNLNSVLNKSFEVINNKCKANCLFFSTYEDFLEQGE